MAKTLSSEIPGQFGGVINEAALARYVTRIEDKHNERKSLNEDITALYAEAKDAGFDTTVLREIVRERQMEAPARHSRYALLDAYRKALGMLADTPLGEAAMQRAEAETAVNGSKRPRAAKPKAFAAQAVHAPRPRGRPRKTAPAAATVDDALDRARHHLGEPALAEAGDDLPPAA